MECLKSFLRKIIINKIKQHKKRVNYTINKYAIDRFKVVADKDTKKVKYS